MPLIAPRRPSFADFKVRLGLYGPEGSGKSHQLLTWPLPLWISPEDAGDAFADRGVRYGVVPVSTALDVEDNFIGALNGDHKCGTAGLDSMTAYIRMLQLEGGQQKEQYKNSQVYARSTRLLARIYNGRRACHVFVTAQEKKEFDQSQKFLGFTWDCDPRFGYPFDILGRTACVNGKYQTLIVKSRFRKIPKGAVITDFGYGVVQDALADAAKNPADQVAPTVIERLAALHASVGAPNGSLSAYVKANGLQRATASEIEKYAADIAQALSLLRKAS